MTAEYGFFTGAVNGHLTGRPVLAWRSSYRPMLKEVLERIEDRLHAVRLSPAAASKLAGLSEDAIRNLRRAVEKSERQGISTATIMALAPVLKTTGSWLLEGVGPEEIRMVRIVGTVGADTDGTVLQTTGQEGWDEAPIPPGGTSASVALEVKGHSMRHLADDGSLVYFEDQRTPPTADMLYYYCVVETDEQPEGRVLVKRLLPGQEPGTYTLESQIGPPLENVRLRWAAEPTAIIPPKQARRIIRRAGESQVA